VRRDFYAVLNVERSATARQIKTAYRRLAREFHPDRNAASDAADRFKEAAEAYAVLSDTARRAQYDRWGDDGLRGQVSPGTHGDESAFE